MSGVRTGKELDPYLRARIGEARIQLENLIKPHAVLLKSKFHGI